MSTFDQAFTRLLGNEGAYSAVAADPGGETMWGITKRVAQANGYQGDMRELSQAVAKTIYRRQYWDVLRADELPEAIRFDLFDAAVNSGCTQAIKWLQRAAGVYDDGIIGPLTLESAALLSPAVIVARFNGQRLAFMTGLPTWSSFGKGWARRIASNLQGA